MLNVGLHPLTFFDVVLFHWSDERGRRGWLCFTFFFILFSILCVASSVTGVSNRPRMTVGSQPLLCPELLCGPLGAAVPLAIEALAVGG